MPPSCVRRVVAQDARGRTGWVVPLLLCAAILLIAGLAFNLAYLDTGGEQFPSTPGSGSPAPSPGGILDPQTAAELIVLGFAAFVVASVIVFLRRKGPRTKRVLRPSSWLDLVALLIAFAVFALVLFVWQRLASPANKSTLPPGSNATGTGNATVFPSVSGIPLGVFLVAALFVSVLLIAFMFRLGPRFEGGKGEPAPRGPRRAAAQAVQAAISELEMGEDVRAAILACYARFCRFLGARGFAAQDALTPRELEDLAVRRLSVSPDSAEALTALFEEARYSVHPLGDPDRERAVQSLERIRADLEA